MYKAAGIKQMCFYGNVSKKEERERETERDNLVENDKDFCNQPVKFYIGNIIFY